jgi:hypothetical protein
VVSEIVVGSILGSVRGEPRNILVEWVCCALSLESYDQSNAGPERKKSHFKYSLLFRHDRK